VLTVIVSIMGMFVCSVSSYCDNNDDVLTVIVTIMGRFLCSVSSYCDNNAKVYMQS
jgi:hypothetical protein